MPPTKNSTVWKRIAKAISSIRIPSELLNDLGQCCIESGSKYQELRKDTNGCNPCPHGPRARIWTDARLFAVARGSLYRAK